MLCRKHTQSLRKSARIGAESGVTQSSNTKMFEAENEQDTICMCSPNLLYLDDQMPQIGLVIMMTLAFCETSRCRRILRRADYDSNKVQISRNHLHFACNSPICGIVHKWSAFCMQSASIYEGIGERGTLVGGFATPGKLANGDPPSSNGT